MVRGEGATVWDEHGKPYLDALSGIAVTALGHANPAMAEALAEQAQRLMHVSNLYQIPEQIALGEALCRVAGMDKAFFCNSGAEANEAAIKIARLHGHHKNIDTPTIIVSTTAFHGRTLGTIAATGNKKVQHGFGPVTPGFVDVPFNDTEAIETIASSRSDVVAVLLEPIQGEGGINVPDDGYLARVRKLCDDNGWLLMLDEIQCGMGRCGTWFEHQNHGIQPDVMSTAKALGNGVPIGACLARGAAADLIQPGSHGTTFGGNPFACRAGITVIDQIESNNLLPRVTELGNRISEGLRARLHNRPGVVEIRGKGLMVGIELEKPCAALVAKALEKGLLINVTADRVVRILPPYILTDKQADSLTETLSDLILTHIESA
jgi:acetylornithine aminotransferase